MKLRKLWEVWNNIKKNLYEKPDILKCQAFFYKTFLIRILYLNTI